jgi:hypothetical protein
MAIGVSRPGPAEFVHRRSEPRLAGPQPDPVVDEADRDYWLARCEGYRVDGREGRIGFVEEVRVGAEHPRGTVLVVRAGRLGRRVLLVSATDAALLVPREQRLWLRTPTAIVGTEPIRTIFAA